VQTDERDLLRAHLTARGVASAVHYPVPVHRTDAYAHLGLHPGSLPVAESMASRVCSLPIFPGIEDWQLEAIGAAAAEAVRADDESTRSLVA
jgi:dTDP-4-amino-4,6-dideoxygalactose transaminase